MTVALTTIGTSVNVATANPGTQNSIETVDKATSIAGNSHTPMDRSVSDPHSGSSVHLPNSPEEPTRLTDNNSGTLSLYGHQGSLKRGENFAITEGENTTVIQKKEQNSVQIAKILKKEKDTQQIFTVKTDKPSKLQKLNDGSINIVSNQNNGPRVTYGTIDKPWAVDAEGKKLPTSYSIDGNKIIQKINTRGASYPIVADPKVTWGWGMYINMKGEEMNALGGVAGVALSIIGVGGCAAVGVTKKIPNLAKVIIGTLCSLGGADLAKSMLNESIHNHSFRPGQCYQIRYPSKGEGWKGVGNENCS